MHKNTAIKVHNLAKQYKLYNQPLDRLKESLNPFGKKYHRDFHALNKINFEIKKSETVGIIGKNGSGKSTLLKLITGVLSPSKGRVLVHGKISAILELGAGFNPEMTGVENVYLNTSINGMTKEQTDKKIQDIIDFAELGDFIHQPLRTYSSGMKARLAFAVSINVEPDILIVDEALSVGDAAFTRKCFAKMEEIRKSGATILFVSHSEGSIVSLCSRAIWIHNGQMVLDGTPKLVTGLYMKNVNKQQINIAEINKEYLTLNALEQSNPVSEKKVLKKSEASSQEEYFDPKISSKSMICYEEKGAKISEVKITTLAGKKVNVLTQGREYIFQYHVDLEDNRNEVLCAMLLKDSKGINLGGGHYPKRHSYIQLNKGSVAFKWKWRCNLLSGEYFINCGISTADDFLHRIVDAYMFKVRNNETDTCAYGPIDFKIKVDYE
jgi:lipopolysaccharide transport system ATP-binding protein